MEGYKYNLLTQRLLAEGYSTEHYPDYVQIDPSQWGKHPLENVSGGFEYKRWYCERFVYKTGCGKYVMGDHVISSLSYMGIDWSHENDCPTIRCPYWKSSCACNAEYLYELNSGLSSLCFCVCHRTEEPYQYESSIEKAEKDWEEKKKRKYDEYVAAHNGRVCINHMYYDVHTDTWEQKYRPENCYKSCSSSFCPILGREKTRKRGNVYYDLKTCYIRHDGTLFDGEKLVYIEKGKRFFGHPVSMDICEAFVKLQPEEITRKYELEHGSINRMIDKSFQFEILNIRAESKPSRDLIQDLEDIKAGIQIEHESDLLKRRKEQGMKQKAEAQARKVRRLEKKLLEIGYENLEEHSLDKRHADKWLTTERIKELEELRLRKEAEEWNKPVQLSIFDL